MVLLLPMGANTSGSQDFMISMALIAAALSIWLLERAGSSQLISLVRTLKKLAPELAALSFGLSLAAALVYCGQHNGGAEIPKEDEALWNDINAEWPVLKTADSLLGIQAMLRLVLLSSALLRDGGSEATSAFAMEPLGFLFLASCTRATLLLASPWEVYHLDGPVGGALNLACEICAVPLTAWLCRPLWRNLYSLTCVLAAMVVLGLLAMQQHLALADPGMEYLDVLFSWSQFLDAAVAVTFLIRTCTLWTAARGEFMVYCVMALLFQQLLSAIFMFTSWGQAPFHEVPGIVGKGHPLTMMQSSSLLEVGCYLVSSVVFAISTSFQKEHLVYAPLFAEL
mmetsp:Transcript_59332/g.72575  ORF Transcript_59332/g.72575 Transcript_59332/m.72575 type:complete len:340 (+) Transcript_59332:62-1081(+)